jgi:Ca2+-binding RTX toxin-like protein
MLGDIIDGGANTSGTDQIQLSNAGTITDAAFAQVSRIDSLTLGSGANTVTLGANADAAVATALNSTLTISGGTSLTLDAGAMMGTGKLSITGTTGNDNITTGAGNDTISGGAGTNIINSGGGDDTINTLSSGTDTINAGSGNDTINLSSGTATVDGGDGMDTVRLTATNFSPATDGQLQNVEVVRSVVTSYGNTTIDLHLQTEDLVISGPTASNNGMDTIIGGSGNDVITGGTYGDTLTGGEGADTFVYNVPSQSTAHLVNGINYTDTITDFTSGVDHLQIGHTLAGLTTGLTGTSGASLYASIAAALSAAPAGSYVANGAAEITLSGTYAGTYVVINDGTATYAQFNDAVIKLGNSAVLTASDFIV